MVSFVNPGVLGSRSTFNQVFGSAIAAGNERTASQEQKELAHARSQELNTRVASFVLRRTAELNRQYLPPLTNFTVFCKPSDLQVRLATLLTHVIKALA